jgi:hypothetical protein
MLVTSRNTLQITSISNTAYTRIVDKENHSRDKEKINIDLWELILHRPCKRQSFRPCLLVWTTNNVANLENFIRFTKQWSKKKKSEQKWSLRGGKGQRHNHPKYSAGIETANHNTNIYMVNHITSCLGKEDAVSTAQPLWHPLPTYL